MKSMYYHFVQQLLSRDQTRTSLNSSLGELSLSCVATFAKLQALKIPCIKRLSHLYSQRIIYLKIMHTNNTRANKTKFAEARYTKSRICWLNEWLLKRRSHRARSFTHLKNCEGNFNWNIIHRNGIIFPESIFVFFR